MSHAYVLGFLFSSDLRNVSLIQKQKPEWQKGRFNGIGGKIEEGEQPPDAMAREFNEETGVWVHPDQWREFAMLHSSNGRHWRVHIFYAVDDNLNHVRTMEEERVILTSASSVVQGVWNTIGNVPWLVAMALAVASGKEGCHCFNIEERS